MPTSPLKAVAVFCLVAGGACLLHAGAAESKSSAEIRFNRDIRPVLSRHCFACHGPDARKRKAKLRLDVREDAISAGAIAPGDLEGSEMIRRLDCEDPDELMPPKKDGIEPLTSEQKDLLNRWVAEGAVYEPHWAWVAPVAPEVPKPDAPESFPIRSELDAFVLAGIREKGWEPAAPATREEWLRRVTIDLTGLPPTVEEIDSFLADQKEGAYERVVDGLLGTVAHAERLACDWLDVARYGDTYGRHED
ncbi:MAG: DUF1549 domain-containing protein, partial [Verrucomicrobiae bacterium]|nr:DUF1549 domain-containing protein [Verrucomicrobiae bacterium]